MCVCRRVADPSAAGGERARCFERKNELCTENRSKKAAIFGFSFAFSDFRAANLSLPVVHQLQFFFAARFIDASSFRDVEL